MSLSPIIWKFHGSWSTLARTCVWVFSCKKTCLEKNTVSLRQHLESGGWTSLGTAASHGPVQPPISFFFPTRDPRVGPVCWVSLVGWWFLLGSCQLLLHLPACNLAKLFLKEPSDDFLHHTTRTTNCKGLVFSLFRWELWPPRVFWSSTRSTYWLNICTNCSQARQGGTACCVSHWQKKSIRNPPFTSWGRLSPVEVDSLSHYLWRVRYIHPRRWFSVFWCLNHQQY